jgi:hypothetical protein
MTLQKDVVYVHNATCVLIFITQLLASKFIKNTLCFVLFDIQVRSSDMKIFEPFLMYVHTRPLVRLQEVRLHKVGHQEV